MDKQATKRSENSPVVGHVATIAGGIYEGGDSRNSKKNYTRREVYGVMNTQIHWTLRVSLGSCIIMGNNVERLDEYNIQGVVYNSGYPQLVIQWVDRETHLNSYKGYSIPNSPKTKVSNDMWHRRDVWR
ncbi:hypothetical protein LIER_26463 [Lithospermum erythrorhizon]|uniref:Uncharacterized protein n=1 Tax=Lithospermum erythrorhizon TaxID=34254 RepID=A0AAV3RAI9_LITER